MNRGFYQKKEDEYYLALIKEMIEKRSSYGYKRITAMIRKKYGERVNKKRIYRIMKKHKLLLPKSEKTRRDHEETGKVTTLYPNTRWCSDCFEIHCFNDEKVYVTFSLDTCDREAISYEASKTDISQVEVQNLMLSSVEKRFRKPKADRSIEWLTDRGSVYRAYKTLNTAKQFNLSPRFTAAHSPESNGMAESFVKTFKRDYVYQNDCYSADWVLEQLPKWFEDYNENHPHSALEMRSPREYRKGQQALEGVN